MKKTTKKDIYDFLEKNCCDVASYRKIYRFIILEKKHSYNSGFNAAKAAAQRNREVIILPERYDGKPEKPTIVVLPRCQHG